MLASVKTSLLQSEEWNREERKLNVKFTEIQCKIINVIQYRRHSLS